MNRKYPLLGTSVVDDRVVEFTWLYARPTLSLTFNRVNPPLIGQVTHLDRIPRFYAAPDNAAWLDADEQRAVALIDLAIRHYLRREECFRFCDG